MNDPTPPADFYRASDYCMQESVGYLMRRVMQSIVTQVDDRLAAHDLTHAQWLPLFKLAQGECGTTAELARDLQIDPGAMTRALDRLEAKGLIRRERAQHDRRVVHLQLTDDGRQVAPAVPAVLAEVLNAHLSGFSAAEWRQLVDLLQRMQRNGDALPRPAGGASTVAASVPPAFVAAPAGPPATPDAAVTPPAAPQ